MTDHPILMRPEMVRALLDGRKTQTRRPIVWLNGIGPVTEFGPSETKGYDWQCRRRDMCWNDLRHDELLARCPYGQPGDRLWVRQAFAFVGNTDPGWLLYRASGYENECARHGFDKPWPDEKTHVRWKPSIHMPRWASRITLMLTDVRVQRMQDISEVDSYAEGVFSRRVIGDSPTHPCWTMSHDGPRFDFPTEAFAAYIDTITPNVWRDNPWVWALTFTVRKGNIDD